MWEMLGSRIQFKILIGFDRSRDVLTSQSLLAMLSSWRCVCSKLIAVLERKEYENEICVPCLPHSIHRSVIILFIYLFPYTL